MSWDIAIARFESIPSNMEELAEADEVPLGALDEVKVALAEVLPDVKWAGGSATYREGEFLGVEIHPSPKRGPIRSLTFMVSASGAKNAEVDAFLTRLKQLTQQNGWTAIDAGRGELVE